MEEMDKLLEDLQKVNVEFNNQLSKYEALIYQTKQTNDKLDKYTESNREKVDRLCIRVEKKLEDINQQVEGISGECQKLFDRYSLEIASLNEEERKSFTNLLMEELNRYKKEFLQSVLKDYENILLGFMEQIRKEASYVVSGEKEIARLAKTTEESNQELVTQIHGLRVIVNGCLEAINHTVGSINDKYLGIFEGFSEKVNSLNKGEREKFLAELSHAMEKYKKDFGVYDSALADSHKTNQELTRLSLQNVETVREMEMQLQERLTQTEKLMEHISKAYEQGFQGFSKDVTTLNSREKEKFVVAIRSVLEDYRFTFGNEIESKAKEMNALFQNTLAGVCNNYAARNQEYLKQLENIRESNMQLHQDLSKKLVETQGLVNSLLFREKTIKEALAFLKEDYKNTVWQYVQELERNNAQDREVLLQTTVQNASANTEKYIRQLEAFKTERSAYLKQMEELLEDEKNSRESMLNRQAETINLLKREQEALKRQITEKQEGLNRYQVLTGTLALVFSTVSLLLLLYLIEPGAFAVMGLVLVVGIGVVITIYRKRIILWIKKRGKPEK